MVSPMELLDRAVAYTGKRVHSLRSGFVKAEDVRKAKRVTLVARQGMYCKKCGNVGPTKGIMKGSFAIELVLWLFFLLPGLVYSIWRLTTKGRGCSVCGSDDVIPANATTSKCDEGRFHPERSRGPGTPAESIRSTAQHKGSARVIAER